MIPWTYRPTAVLLCCCLSEPCPQSGCAGPGPLPTDSHLIAPPQTSELAPLFWKFPRLSLGSVLLTLHLGPRKSTASWRFPTCQGLPGKLCLHPVNSLPVLTRSCDVYLLSVCFPRGSHSLSFSPNPAPSAQGAEWASEQKARGLVSLSYNLP